MTLGNRYTAKPVVTREGSETVAARWPSPFAAACKRAAERAGQSFSAWLMAAAEARLKADERKRAKAKTDKDGAE